MTNDFVLIMQTVLTQAFRLFTAWRLPGVGFTPAVLLFGILSFSVAISVVHGIMTITASGLGSSKGHSDKAEAATRRFISRGE